jgi:hypothetical protein
MASMLMTILRTHEAVESDDYPCAMAAQLSSRHGVTYREVSSYACGAVFRFEGRPEALLRTAIDGCPDARGVTATFLPAEATRQRVRPSAPGCAVRVAARYADLIRHAVPVIAQHR